MSHSVGDEGRYSAVVRQGMRSLFSKERSMGMSCRGK